MEIITTYNLVNPKGNTLRLQLGSEPDSLDQACCYWRFIGMENPCPVLNGLWFVGFTHDPAEMLEWCKGNGWHLRTSVDMRTGEAEVYDLPEPKGNEYSKAIEVAVQHLYCNNGRIKAVNFYADYYQCSIPEAREAVMRIVNCIKNP